MKCHLNSLAGGITFMEPLEYRDRMICSSWHLGARSSQGTGRFPVCGICSCSTVVEVCGRGNLYLGRESDGTAHLFAGLQGVSER